jgi:hypothetical protein
MPELQIVGRDMSTADRLTRTLRDLGLIQQGLVTLLDNTCLVASW